MSEQIPIKTHIPLADELARATFLDAAETVLGVSPNLNVGQQDLEKPPHLSWNGGSTAVAAYVTALRAIAPARCADREAMGFTPGERDAIRQFNKRWNKQLLAADNKKLLTLKVREYSYREGSDDPAKAAAGEELRRRVTRAARNVLLAKNILSTEAVPSDAWADTEGPRYNLQQYFKNVLRWFAVSPPRSDEKTAIGRRPLLPHAFVLTSPTGVGKTMVGGNLLARARIGEVRQDGGRRRALWITVSQALMEDCTDPEKTLQKCLPDGVTTTKIYEGNKELGNADGDLVCVTKQSLEEALDAGLISPDDFDVIVFDDIAKQITTTSFFDTVADALQHKPSRLLGDAKILGELD